MLKKREICLSQSHKYIAHINRLQQIGYLFFSNVHQLWNIVSIQIGIIINLNNPVIMIKKIDGLSFILNKWIF